VTLKPVTAISLIGIAGLVFALHWPGSVSGTLAEANSTAGIDLTMPMDSLGKQKHAEFGVLCSECHGTMFSIPVPGMEQCADCHGSYDDVAALTAGRIPDPHHSHMGEVACGQCHREHEASVFSCNDCHVFEMEVP
jgi:RecJ-like exonuclease